MPPDLFWSQTPRLLNRARNGYQARVDIAIMLAGGKPVKEQKEQVRQTPEQMIGVLQSWAGATAHMGQGGAGA